MMTLQLLSSVISIQSNTLFLQFRLAPLCISNLATLHLFWSAAFISGGLVRLRRCVGGIAQGRRKCQFAWKREFVTVCEWICCKIESYV